MKERRLGRGCDGVCRRRPLDPAKMPDARGRQAGRARISGAGPGGGRALARRRSSSRDREVEQVPRDAVEERRVVGAGEVEHLARHPAAERHAEQRAHQHVPTRAPASRGGKYSRTMIAYDGTMPPWNRPNSAEIT